MEPQLKVKGKVDMLSHECRRAVESVGGYTTQSVIHGQCNVTFLAGKRNEHLFAIVDINNCE